MAQQCRLQDVMLWHSSQRGELDPIDGDPRLVPVAGLGEGGLLNGAAEHPFSHSQSHKPPSNIKLPPAMDDTCLFEVCLDESFHKGLRQTHDLCGQSFPAVSDPENSETMVAAYETSSMVLLFVLNSCHRQIT